MHHRQSMANPRPIKQARLVEHAPSSRWHAQSIALYNHWISHSLTGAPPWEAFDPLDWPSFLPNIWLLDVTLAPFRMKFRLVGTRVVEQIQTDPTGRWLDEALPHLASNIEFLERYRTSAIERVPVWTIGPADIRPNNPIRAVENLILPFTTDSRENCILLMFAMFHVDIRN
jgi:hypothetical protein